MKKSETFSDYEFPLFILVIFACLLGAILIFGKDLGIGFPITIILIVVLGFCCGLIGHLLSIPTEIEKYHDKDNIEEGKHFKAIDTRVLDDKENPNELLLYICFDEEDYYLLKANKSRFNTEDPQPGQTYVKTNEVGVKKYTFSTIEVKD